MMMMMNNKNLLLWHDTKKPTLGDDPHGPNIDPSTLALLTDLYCSPLGPNIRSSVAHGRWNDFLVKEWCESPTTYVTEARQKKMWDMVTSIYIAMAQLSGSSSSHQQSQ
jgi:hypothetical protein